MRILVLHSDVTAGMRPDDLDTLIMGRAIAAALEARGHAVSLAPFKPDADHLRRQCNGADIVFNLVETALGQDDLAALAPAMLTELGIAFTGSKAAAMMVTTDKPATKRILRALALPTPDWHEGPGWAGLAPTARYIVKSATADASLGLDDASVVRGSEVPARAAACAAHHGGRWFAEAYIEGREFNVALLDDGTGVRVLPLAEMCFVNWSEVRPRIVGYAAKWNAEDNDSSNTVRRFGCEDGEPALAHALQKTALDCWNLFGLAGYARVDFRIAPDGVPLILEVNTNPCLSPDAGFAFAAAEVGLDYAHVIEVIAKSATP